MEPDEQLLAESGLTAEQVQGWRPARGARLRALPRHRLPWPQGDRRDHGAERRDPRADRRARADPAREGGGARAAARASCARRRSKWCSAGDTTLAGDQPCHAGRVMASVLSAETSGAALGTRSYTDQYSTALHRYPALSTAALSTCLIDALAYPTRRAAAPRRSPGDAAAALLPRRGPGVVQTYPVSAAQDQEAWRASVDVLGAALRGAARTARSVQIVCRITSCATHWCRGTTSLVADAERLAFARLALREIYGGMADSWDV